MFTHTPTRSTGTHGSESQTTDQPSIPPEHLEHQIHQPLQQIMNDGNASTSRNIGLEIGAATIQKLPPFWTHNPKLWFLQIESLFALSGISRDETKFRYIVANMDTNICEYVSDIMFNPPNGTTQYCAIKERLLSAFGESDESRIRKILNGLNLGDQKPSQFLQRLKNLASNQIGDNVLKSIFLEQMPEQARAILAVADASLTNLAEQADKIIEVLKPTTICAVSTKVHQNTSFNLSPDPKIDPVQQLMNEVKTLSSRVEQLSIRGRSHERSKSRSKFRSKSRNREWCWYHNHFGSNATKCTNPCTFTKN